MDNNNIKIILLLMIKNESKIIKRCIESCIDIVDGIVIEDTGSTDNTVEVLVEYFRDKNDLSCGIYQHAWKNFGHNRSLSFKSAVDFIKRAGPDWKPEKTYILALDADMILRYKNRDDLKKHIGSATATGFLLVQKAGTLFYHNMRLMRADYEWRCVGSTHEFWAGPYDGGTVDQNTIWIDDMNDGGCKADKYERDLKMLSDEMALEPENSRTHFYYAQTLRCLGRKQESIEAYKKRIELGGWFEEVWYSYYSIAHMYIEQGDIQNAEIWAEKAFTYNGYRAEAFYILVKHHRNYGNFWKAMHYLKRALEIPQPPVALFLETHVYSRELLFELSVLHYYISTNRIEGARHSMTYLLQFSNDLVFNNLTFYVESLTKIMNKTTSAIPVSNRGTTWTTSSCSLTKWKGKRIMNQRVVNYSVSPRGEYTIQENDGVVRTRNFIYTGKGLKDSGNELITPVSEFTEGCHIRGLEDVRLFVHPSTNELWYTATGMEWNRDHKYRMLIGRCVGDRDQENGVDIFRAENQTEIYRSDGLTADCEKNWTILPSKNSDKITCIYSWKPYCVGHIQIGKTTSVIDFVINKPNVPEYFQYLRGSTNFVEYDSYLWGICHSVRYGSPRKYMHHIVKLDSATYMPVGISVPFSFNDASIEYCLGFIISDTGICTMIWSTFDSNPCCIEIDIDNISERLMIDFVLPA